MGASGATTEVLAQAAGSASSRLARLEATTTDVDRRATVGRSIDQEMARATSQFDSDRRVNQPQAQAIEKQLQVLKSTGNAVAAQQAGLHAMERQFPPHRISSKAFAASAGCQRAGSTRPGGCQSVYARHTAGAGELASSDLSVSCSGGPYMIIELFGPPGAGKTTLLRALCRELAKRDIRVKTVNGYRRIDFVSFGSEVDSVEDEGPETRHGIQRLVHKLATASPVLFSTPPSEGAAARLLASIPPKSRIWALRLKIDVVLLFEAWNTAQASEGYFIFEEGIVQALCALVLLARNPSIDMVRDCMTFLPRPDLLIQVDAPGETLRHRLIERYARQPYLERLLEVGVVRGLKQADIAREIGQCLQDKWPLMRVDGLDPRNFEQVVARIVGHGLPATACVGPD
ncbi:AAA family ATPase [Mesorhizobium sp. M0184]|uniref:AAA family ATPase n=1 Tax=Mesorhizobium sp. M0184 TaxID=2956906 RepID=UPI0033375013